MTARTLLAAVLLTGLTVTPPAGEPIGVSARQVLRTTGHGDLTSVAFGRLKGEPIAISAGREGSVRLWKLPSFRPAAEPLAGTRAGYVEIGGRPAVFTTGGYGGRLWDLETRERLLSVPGPIAAFAFGRDTLFTGTDKGLVSVWSLRTRSAVRSFSVAHGKRGPVPPPALAAWGSRLIAQHGSLSVWDPVSGRRAGPPLHRWSEPVESDDVGPYESRSGTIEVVTADGATTVFGIANGALHSWDLDDRRFPHNYFAGLDEVSYSAFAAGGGFVVAGERTDVRGRVAVWDMSTQRRVRTLTGHVLDVTALAMGTLNDVPAVLSGSADNTVRLWDPATGRELGRTVPTGPIRAVKSIARATVDGRPIALTADGDGLLRLWDLRRRTILRRSFRFAPDPAPSDVKGVDVRGLAVTTLNGAPVAIVSHRDLTVVDLSALTEIRTIRGLGDFQLLRRAGAPAVVAREARSDRARFSTWDLATGQRLDHFDLDLDTTGDGVWLDRLDDRPVAIYRAGGRGRKGGRVLRVWDPHGKRELPAIDLDPRGLRDADMEEDLRVLTGHVRGHPVVLTHHHEYWSWAHLHDTGTGLPLGRALHLGGVPILFGEAGGRSVAVVHTTPEVSGDRHLVRLWDLTARKPVTAGLRAPMPRTVALGDLDGSPVLLVADVNDEFWFWRLTP
ncbi:WD40 repeat domain-containing protein [Nonomuraea sp. NPDC050547]|uniref:WD40 repeat domain-containing protein n=1 Tax=unclassified Nonomuraea TaxID=2593643 RepID=UPI00379696AC